MTDKDQLLGMGFPSIRVEKALRATKNAGLQPALDWILEHQDDPDIDQPLPQGPVLTLSSVSSSGTQKQSSSSSSSLDQIEGDSLEPQPQDAKSLQCQDCGKLLKSTQVAEYHAAKTGHQNFAESTEEVKSLTEEEKRLKLEELKQKLAEKRAKEQEEEKLRQRENEKMRRITGKEITAVKQKTQEDLIKKQLEEQKRQKQEDLRARQRIKEQIEADKRARAEKAAREKMLREGGSGDQSMSQQVLPQANSPLVTPEIKGDYSESRLQVRAPGKSPIVLNCKSDDTLSVVCSQLTNDHHLSQQFTLSTTFPRKQFTSADMNKTLKELDLVPSAAIILQFI
ncbi:hypothetical protein MIR68_006987 [Amoeboaphelidium protococcarum]|nr:hypothetical protein MIR68_006987 [Amoeboaphelidium protococcarum]